MKKNRQQSVLLMELRQDWNTFQGLHGRRKAEFVWDYYRWKIAAILFALIILFTFARILWEGQKPCRLRVCVVLNTEDNCSVWFKHFTEELTSDGLPGAVDVNLDQPFDYENTYYYVQELEVMSAISSGRMDAAICGEDMYQYLLALNACLPLDEALSAELSSLLSESGKLVRSTANLTQDRYGNVNPEDGIDGYYAVDLSGTGFDDAYNQTEEGEPLYAVIISNTEHLADCESLLTALLGF